MHFRDEIGFRLKNFVSRLRRIKSEGIRWKLVQLFARFLKQENEIQRVKDRVWRHLFSLHGMKIAYGPFKGMVLPRKTSWSSNDKITQILGVYEEHVLERIVQFSEPSRQVFIDIGAGDGYFSTGTAYSKLYSKVFAFEARSDGRKVINQSAADNYCRENVTILGEANYGDLKNILDEDPNPLVLVDIEGGEYDFLSLDLLTLLKGSVIICELHPWLIEGGWSAQAALLERASRLFDLELISRENYAPNKFKELDRFTDEERLISMGEGRDINMQWLVMTPLRCL